MQASLFSSWSGSESIILSIRLKHAPRAVMNPEALRWSDEVSRRLQRLTGLTGRNRIFDMIEAIKENLDDLEDLSIAEQRLIDIRAGKSETVPLEEVMKRYGLES